MRRAESTGCVTQAGAGIAASRRKSGRFRAAFLSGVEDEEITASTDGSSRARRDAWRMRLAPPERRRSQIPPAPLPEQNGLARRRGHELLGRSAGTVQALQDR